MAQKPRIVGGGGIPPGLVRNSMPEMVNLVPTPTIFQLCGIDETFSHNGKSLLPSILEDRHLPKILLSRRRLLALRGAASRAAIALVRPQVQAIAREHTIGGQGNIQARSTPDVCL